MIEPLVVEPSRLETAGNTLRELPFPVPPAPIVAPGSDPVSAAVNVTLPIIESPVVDGLPAVKAALTRTGSSIAAAAGMYTDTDQRLGDRLTQVEFLATADKSGAAASGDKPEGAPVDDEKPSPTPTPKPVTPTPQPAEMAGAAGMLGSVMQPMQSAMGSMQGAGATPAQLADSTKPDDQAREENKSDDEAESEGPAEGAAPGTQTPEAVPTRAPTGSRAGTVREEINL